jgi:glycosyltransferase involved in cell wall biosynthesis
MRKTFGTGAVISKHPPGQVVIVAPTVMKIDPEIRYGGVERLAFEFANGFLKHGWKVMVICTEGSILPRGAIMVDVGPAGGFAEENIESGIVAAMLNGNWDDMGWIDFSHSLQIGRNYGDQNHMSVMWHDPALLDKPMPNSNVVALSEWQAERYDQQDQKYSRVLSPICVNDGIYTPGHPSNRTKRLVFVGKMHETKGALKAIELCKKYGYGLDVIGGLGLGDDPVYLEQVKAECDVVAGDGKPGKITDIAYWGEISDNGKITLLQNALAMIYPVNYAMGFGEAHSHKMLEAMIVGTPCIVWDQGAMKEVVQEGITGFVIRGDEELPDAVSKCENLNRNGVDVDGHSSVRDWARDRYSTRTVIASWAYQLSNVIAGERW